MEIQLADFQDGKPMVFKGTKDAVETVAELKKAKNYKEMLQVSMKMPPNKDTYMLRASALLHLKQWNKLIDCCNNGLALDENESEFYNLKGKAIGKLGNQQEKAQLLRIAVDLNGQVPAYHRNLGAAYYSLKKYDQAITEHGKAIYLQPNNPINYHNIGAAHFRLSKYEEASDYFSKALERDPRLALSYSWKGDSEKKLGRNQEAIGLYKKAFQLSGNAIYLQQKQKLEKEIKKEQPKEKKKLFGIF